MSPKEFRIECLKCNASNVEFTDESNHYESCSIYEYMFKCQSCGHAETFNE